MTWPQQIPRRLLSALHLISDQPLHQETGEKVGLPEQPGQDPGDFDPAADLEGRPTKASAVDFDDLLRALGCEG